MELFPSEEECENPRPSLVVAELVIAWARRRGNEALFLPNRRAKFNWDLNRIFPPFSIKTLLRWREKLLFRASRAVAFAPEFPRALNCFGRDVAEFSLDY